MIIWAVGTTNKAKLDSVDIAVRMCFPSYQHDVRPVAVLSIVRAQPISAEESQQGAQHRAHEALSLVPEAHYGVGLEGGLEKISDRWFECGWMYVIERSTGRCGIGSSARFEMSQKLMSKILDEGKELAEVMDEMTGETDVRSGQGAMGVLTAGYLNRAESYSHGLIFALAPFLSDHKYWD
ncbi:hypothetical protein C3747_141g11 [Trypanosoma cruzi]|uniref:inosine/xanthosine triphosphatase n=2 Tax=Trypanosoma cruzi TaxID=5693 RepID=Q4DIT7_TRYCC|nr:hypothetical protein, conserved [Trypanosoma cruzi]EAN92449.1 hypothetical protein, conserved [Trypanosoma cruzi]PWV04888.1 hypothetical protein C3747_141g11 [Trypanosoma cruzi]RNC45411.1 hypothetical protein TcCL_NonESM04837 [Trypanosoma cruzi]|eukprot:XP_814300.1 hypothetical protein [Trypanosoma cruzi strain CL Brener]